MPMLAAIVTDAETLAFDDDTLWRAIRTRDTRYDGLVWYGVQSTGIYCRPTCPSRRPKRGNVRLFREPEAARAAGFRPCRRCAPERPGRLNGSAPAVVAACRFIAAHETGNPTLAELAAHVRTSPGYLQKAFRRALGVTPKQYADELRVARLRRGLAGGDDIARATFDAGFGSSSRVYERAAGRLGMTPAAYQGGGRGARVDYTIVPCPLGRLLVARTERGLCAVRLGDSARELERGLRAELGAAQLTRRDDDLGGIVEAIVAYLAEGAALPQLPLDVRATAFQAQVWDALRRIPPGETMTYGEVAAALGRPTAARAVARACASNPCALVIPCHRVVPKAGGVGGYRWKAQRKEALLEMEFRATAKRAPRRDRDDC